MRAFASACTLVCFFATTAGAGAVGALANKYQITAEEQSACGSDELALCSAAYPDDDKLLSCMKVNRPRLSVACRPIFDEGMRRRHLN